MNYNESNNSNRQKNSGSIKGTKEASSTNIKLISELINFYKNVSINNQYDEFLHKIQQDRMKELWDNKEDEAWENV